MSCKVTAGVALAMPVKPDDLCERLEAYAKVVPTLHTLRLCQRFGTGPDVYITKLPNEIELAIEKIIFSEKLRQVSWFSKWSRAFCHYEGRCAPMDHLPDSYSPLSDAVEDVEFCSSCEDSINMDFTHGCETFCGENDANKCRTCQQKRDPDNCMNTCQAHFHESMNEMVLDNDDGMSWSETKNCEVWEPDCDRWDRMIDQSPGGKFSQYDELLRKHFGLEVFFSEARISQGDSETWPRHINHGYHSLESLKTTICYLTVAKSLAPQKTYESSDYEIDTGQIGFTGAQAIVLKPNTSKDRINAHKRFARAKEILRVRASSHPSQRHMVIMPKFTDDGDVDSSSEHAKVNLGSWPRPVLLVKVDTLSLL